MSTGARPTYEPPRIEQTVSLGAAELVELGPAATVILVLPAQRPYPLTSKRLELLHTLAALAARTPPARLEPGRGPMTLRFVAGVSEAPRRHQRIVRRDDFFRRKSWRF